MSGRRRVAVWALVALASVALVLALVVGYVRRAAVDSEQFANRATVALKDDSVRSLIAERVTDQVVLARASELTAVRPLVESVVSSVVGGRAFTGAFRSSVRDVHRALFARDESTVTLALADVGTMVAAGLQFAQPSVARRIETTGKVEVIRRNIGDANATLVRVADTIDVLAPLLLLVAVLCAAGAIWLSAERRRTIVHLGAGAAIGGLVLIVAWDIARTVAVGQVDGADAREAVGAVWDAFLGDLRTAAWILAGCGAVVAAAAASLIRPVTLDAPLRRAAGWIAAEPTWPALRVLRGVALVAVGLVCVLAWQTVARALITVAGVYLVFAGVSAILALVYQPRTETETEAEPRRRARRRRWVAPVLATARRRGRHRRLRRVGRDDDRGAGGGAVQRAPGAVRPLAARGGAGGDAQLHVGPAARVVRRRAGRADRRSAALRHPRAALRHALRRQARTTGGCAPTSARTRRSRSWRGRTA